jgi:hypothetical protein
MTKDEIYEEIRTQLREAQEATVQTPWRYDDGDLVPQIRSAIRYLNVLGVQNVGVMNTSGEFTTEPSPVIGLCIAYRIVHRLLTGDLMRKLLDGELGVVFRSGSDYIDTKTASQSFALIAERAEGEFSLLLAAAMANADGGASSVFGSGAINLEG